MGDNDNEALSDKPFDEEYFNNGLSSAEASIRLDKYGRNEIPEAEVSKWKVSERCANNVGKRM